MRKWAWNYILFILLFLFGLCQAVSGFVLWLVLSTGQGLQGGRGLVDTDTGSFLSWTRHEWIDFHDWTALALVVLVVVHLILHWKWIIYTTKKVVTFQQ